ncbi:MAG: RIP metalloprotease RseP [bacterium]
MNFIISIAGILFTLGVVIFVHELGHFLACKAVGIRVLKFAFAFGKEVFGFDWKGTRYSFGWIPLGGYVKPAGEDYLEKMDQNPEPPKKDEYFGKPWYQRIMVVVAGPFMNYCLALFIFSFVFWVWGGVPKFSGTTVIGEVQQGMPAEASGLKTGDAIIKIDDAEVKTWDDMAQIIHQSPEKELRIELIRDGKRIVKTITPRLDQENMVGLIGIYPDVSMTDFTFFQSIKQGAGMTWLITAKTLSYVGGTIRRMEKPKEVSGPIGIFKFISDAAQTGFRELLSLVGLLSVAIGLFNLFPIPLLDGGHLVFYLIEGIIRKPLNQKVMLVANYVGLGLLLSIFVYASYNDVVRLRRKNTQETTTEQSISP